MRYNDENRNEIWDRLRFTQPILFKGLETVGGICPTDIDAITEYHDKLYIIVEVKKEGASISKGQVLCLTRLIDALEASGRIAILCICLHNTDASEDVLLADTRVALTYYHHTWRKIEKDISFGNAWKYWINWAKQMFG